ncbi:right-handed parallel beta-helix repeat-containing protein [Frankia sp. Cpl3]|nr:right-handed parallel beta-helix repeat-containing protein [Frankia sp. Cpl3]
MTPTTPRWKPRTALAALAPLAVLAAVTALTTLTALPAQAKPVPPLPPVSSGDAKQQSVLVDAEDIRMRSMFERFGVLTAPTLVEVAGSQPTLLLPARRAPYSAEDVIAAGGGRREVDGAVLFTAHVLVGPQARLVIDASVGTLRLASGAAGFTSVSTWRGGLEFAGATPDNPLTVIGWDVQNLEPDSLTADGRSYLRTMGGELILRNVSANHLGFWNGRTGGVAWTGSKGEPSTGGAANSTFSNNIYGAYVSGSEGIQMIGVRLTDNERSGLAVHRDAITTLVSGVTAARNHGDGMTIDRASGSRVMRSTVADNSGDGISLDGRGLGVIATATGVQINQIRDTLIEENTVSANGRYGIRVVGGENTIVRKNTISDGQLGIIVKSGANGTQVTGNTITGPDEAGIQIGPDARRTAITENAVSDSRLGVITQEATTNIISRNKIRDATEFAITVRGPADGTAIQWNTLAGEGWRAVDIRKALGVREADVHHNNAEGWVEREPQHWYTLIRRHPALVVWGAVALFPILGAWTRHRARRRPPMHPYPESELLVRRLTGGTMRPDAAYSGIPGQRGAADDLAPAVFDPTPYGPAAFGPATLVPVAGSTRTAPAGAAVATSTALAPVGAGAAGRGPASPVVPQARQPRRSTRPRIDTADTGPHGTGMTGRPFDGADHSAGPAQWPRTDWPGGPAAPEPGPAAHGPGSRWADGRLPEPSRPAPEPPSPHPQTEPPSPATGPHHRRRRRSRGDHTK